jgi:hypothetical protein
MLPDASYYGAIQAVQPSGLPAPLASPGETTPIRTTALAGNLGIFHQAGFWIAAMVALAIGLVHFSIRFS